MMTLENLNNYLRISLVKKPWMKLRDLKLTEVLLINRFIRPLISLLQIHILHQSNLVLILSSRPQVSARAHPSIVL